jgi:hypothetical protein
MISETAYLIVILTLFLVMILILYFYPHVILRERLRAILPMNSEWTKNACKEVYIQSSSIEMPESLDTFLAK